MSNPKLVPPCSGWREDLPHPEESPVVVPALGSETPNYRDNIFLELSRKSSLIRGLVIWFMPVMVFALAEDLWFLFTIEQSMSIDGWVIFICTSLMVMWAIPICWRFEVSPPRDQPLRFNRARQRLYAYNFNYSWWNPFARWGVEVVAYDWSQVRAERWLKRGATGNGVIIKGGVVLSIVRPGTNEVIDRFPLTTMGADAHAWAYICTYMQQGPDALPPPGPAKDHNDVGMNIALLLAPKVKWPADMDRESRTAP
ncbi:DUF6708 domain-containing protein [Pseudomonas bharatica]|nr:DUF6708 domain-containing protein [Pseudomonas bharatica]